MRGIFINKAINLAKDKIEDNAIIEANTINKAINLAKDKIEDNAIIEANTINKAIIFSCIIHFVIIDMVY